MWINFKFLSCKCASTRASPNWPHSPPNSSSGRSASGTGAKRAASNRPMSTCAPILSSGTSCISYFSGSKWGNISNGTYLILYRLNLFFILVHVHRILTPSLSKKDKDERDCGSVQNGSWSRYSPRWIALSSGVWRWLGGSRIWMHSTRTR